MASLVAGILGLSCPVAIFVFVFWAYKRGKKSMESDEAALRESALRRGMKVHDSERFDVFVASGTVGGIELHVERRSGIDQSSRVRANNHQAQVRGRLSRPLSASFIVPRDPDDPIPEPSADMREIEIDRAVFDELFRTFAADENATRALLDDATRAGLSSLAGSRLHGRLTSLRCGSQEVAVTLQGALVDASLIDRALDVVLGLCAPRANAE